MTIKASIMKPGILVSLHTAVRGGVTYRRTDLDEKSDDGRKVSRWETERVVEDPQELARATKVRSEARNLIRKPCIDTPFGLLCPEDREQDLDEAIAQAQELAVAHNGSTSYTQISIYALKGRIASTDEEAARAIAEEVQSLLQRMKQGVDGVDVKAIREAANRARALGAMLEPEQQKAVSAAVDAARTAARDIVKRVEKGGEAAEEVIAEQNLAPVELARFAFLDLDEEHEHDGNGLAKTMPAVDLGRVANLEV